MNHIMIVDDEIKQCRGLRNILMKQYPYYQITAFTDAKEALDFMKNKMIQIVITDIRMPEMNGLELTGKIRELDKETKIILLTGYAEFEYAQQAISLGAFDYLLKPLNLEKLYAVFARIEKQIEQEKLLLEQQNKIKEQLNVAFPVYLEQQFNQWVYGRLSDEDKAEIEKIFLGHSSGTVIATHLQGWDSFVHDLSQADIAEYQLQIKWWIRNLLKKSSHTISFFSQTLPETMITIVSFENPQDHEDQLLNSNKFRLEIQKIKEILKSYPTLGIGKKTDDLLENIEDCYKTAITVLDYQFYFGAGTVLFSSYILSKCIHFYGTSLVEESSFKDAIWQMDHDKAIFVLDTVFERRLTNGYVEPEKLREGILHFVRHGIQYFEGFYGNKEWENFQLQIELGLRSQPSYEKFRQKLYDDITQLIDQIVMKKTGKGMACVEKFRTYLEKHYQEDISLEQIASNFELTPCYFSNLIKDLTGISFSKNLIITRISKAKQLLYQSDLKIYEIAQQIGYTDVKYFNRVFKKEVGVSPIQYRERQIQDDCILIPADHR